MRKILYTAIIGNYDRLFPVPPKLSKGWKLRCFTDQEALQCNRWEIVKVSSDGLPDVAMSRKIKILSHQYVKEADISIWIDGAIKVIGSLDDFVERFPGSNFVISRHPDRNCVYEEMDACVKHKKADPSKIVVQRKKYLEMGFPANFGLAQAGVILRRNTERVAEVNSLWWGFTVRFGTWRDQITFPLVMRILDFNPKMVSKNLISSYFQQKVGHKGIYL